LASDPRSKRQSASLAIVALVFAGVVLRAELALLLAPVALQMLISRDIPFTRLVVVGLISAAASAGAFLWAHYIRVLTLLSAATVLVDTYFWSSQYWLWPELYSVWFNVYEGKSVEWGVSPIYDYVLKHIPKLTLLALPLASIGTFADQRVWAAVFPTGVFVGLISLLAHKEWRFVVYVVPLINVAAARGAAILWSRQASRNIKALVRLVVVGCIAANVTATLLLTRISMLNYPGGAAMATLDSLARQRTNGMSCSTLSSCLL